MEHSCVLVIPALNPPYSFVEYAASLKEAGFSRILVIDDGSRTDRLPVFMKLKTGSSANLKPETVISALCTFADIEYDPLALRILRLDLYGEDGKPLSETGRSF